MPYTGNMAAYAHRKIKKKTTPGQFRSPEPVHTGKEDGSPEWYESFGPDKPQVYSSKKSKRR